MAQAARWSPKGSSCPRQLHLRGASGRGRRKRRSRRTRNRALDMVTSSHVGVTSKARAAKGPAWDSSNLWIVRLSRWPTKPVSCIVLGPCWWRFRTSGVLPLASGDLHLVKPSHNKSHASLVGLQGERPALQEASSLARLVHPARSLFQPSEMVAQIQAARSFAACCAATASMPVQRCKEARCTAERSCTADSRARAVQGEHNHFATARDRKLRTCVEALAFRRLFKRRAGDTIGMW